MKKKEAPAFHAFSFDYANGHEIREKGSKCLCILTHLLKSIDAVIKVHSTEQLSNVINFCVYKFSSLSGTDLWNFHAFCNDAFLQ